MARYINHFEISDADLAKATKALLNMGEVAISATVFVNGEEVGTSWVAPHRLDVLGALKPGTNRIEIRVATLWINQLIADAALPDTTGFVPETQSYGVTNEMIDWFARNQPPPPGPRKTFATQNFFTADSPRVPAGLIGPVRLTLE